MSDRHIAAIPADLDEVRVRFAPSPTGSLHIGGARLVMYNVLFTRGQAAREGKRGTFILRIEDTDQKRYVEGSAEGLMEDLRWLGFEWDEGPDIGGPNAPYVQSERTARYQVVAEQLIATGHAYRCFCTPERLKAVREDLQRRKLPTGYDRTCRDLPLNEVDARLAAGERSVVRFRMPLDGETRFVDLLRGEIVYQNETIEDHIILKSDGFPTYHLGAMVDDHDMRITHITRGPEWIPSAPLHIQIFQALDWPVPILAHMPLILATTGGKLSKRHGGASVKDFQEGGYLPEALLNYLVLLGWSLDGKQEIYTLDDLLAHFSLERVSPAPSTFDRDKIDWLNQQWINHHITVEDLAVRVLPFLIAAGTIEDGPRDATHPRYADVLVACGLLKDRIRVLTEAPDLMSYFLQAELPDYDAALLIPKKVDLNESLASFLVTQQNSTDPIIKFNENTMKSLASVIGHNDQLTSALEPIIKQNEQFLSIKTSLLQNPDPMMNPHGTTQDNAIPSRPPSETNGPPFATVAMLALARNRIEKMRVENKLEVESGLRALADEQGVKAGQLFMAVRAAATGRTQSPGLFETLAAIGHDRVLARLDIAIAKLDDELTAR